MVQIVVGTKIFLFSTMTRLALEYQGSLPGFNWAGCELTTDIHPFLRLEWSYTSNPPICFHNVDREKFIIEFGLPVCSV
jgi:hypothetical protein